MAYETLKDSIKKAIKQNGNQEITGDVMQTTLLNMIESIESRGLVFAGVISPRDYVIPSIESFYACIEIGTYEAFNVYKPNAQLSFLTYKGNKWNLETIVEPIIAAAVQSNIELSSFSWIGDSTDDCQLESSLIENRLPSKRVAVDIRSCCKKYRLKLYDANKNLLDTLEFTSSSEIVVSDSVFNNTRFMSVGITTPWNFSHIDSPFFTFCLAYVVVFCNALPVLCSNIGALERLCVYNMNSCIASIEARASSSLYIFQRPNTGVGNRLELFLSEASSDIDIELSFYDVNALLLHRAKLEHTNNRHISIDYDMCPEGLSAYFVQSTVTQIKITNRSDKTLQAKAVAANIDLREIRESAEAEYESLLKSDNYSLIKFSSSRHPLYVTCNLKAGRHYKICVRGTSHEISSSVRDINNTETNIKLLFKYESPFGKKNDDNYVTLFDFFPDKDYTEIGFSDKTGGLAIFEEKSAIQENQYDFGIVHSEMFLSKDKVRADNLYTFDSNSVEPFTEYVLELIMSKSKQPVAFSVSSINGSTGELVETDILISAKNYAAIKPIGDSNTIIATFTTTKAADRFKFFMSLPSDVNAHVIIYKRTEASKKLTCINPLSYKDCSDPTVWEDKVAHGLYALGSPWAFTNYELLNSADGKIWHTVKNYYPFDDTTKALFSNYTSGIWAPCMFKMGEKYRIYSGLVKPSESVIAIFESTSPFGKFRYIKSILSSVETGIPDTIDPCVVYGEDSKLYIFYGSIGGIYRAELSSDGLTAETSPELVVKCTQADGTRNKSYEGVYLYWHDGYWYMFVSAGNFNSNYRLCVGRSKTITGEFIDRDGNRLLDASATVILKGNKEEAFYSPGHNGEIFIENGKYYMYFHAISNINFGEFNSALGLISNRQLFKQELKWSSVDGFPEFDNCEICNVFNY